MSTLLMKYIKKIKNKNVQVKEIERLLEQAKAVSTIEQQPQQPVKIDYESESMKLQLVSDEQHSSHVAESNHQRRMAILATLPPLDGDISNDEIIAEFRLLCSQFMSPVFKIIPLIKLFMNQLSAEKHGK
jgi:hypothetical protein